MTDQRTKNEERELLEHRIEESRLTTGEFARAVLVREPRTVRRWLSGESPIPNQVKEWLADPTPAPWPLGGDGLRSPDGYTIEGERYADEGEMPGIFESVGEARDCLRSDLKAWNDDPCMAPDEKVKVEDFEIEPVWIGSPLSDEAGPPQEPADVTCHIPRETLDKIARLIDDPVMVYDERILLVCSEPAQSHGKDDV